MYELYIPGEGLCQPRCVAMDSRTGADNVAAGGQVADGETCALYQKEERKNAAYAMRRSM